MEYSVSKLAKMAKVSVRTLHYYDEIGLLKPAYHAINGYRYYGEKELLRLQQILFFRELGVELKKIKNLLPSTTNTQIAALSTHRNVLERKRKRMGELIETIDQTIQHLKGEIHMSEKDFYKGFDPKQQEQYEKYLIKTYGEQSTHLIAESKKRTQHWKKAEWETYRKKSDDLYKALAKALMERKRVDTDEVQELMQKHYETIELFYTPTKEVYIGLGVLYQEHPDFCTFFDSYHPKLASYVAQAMEVYAENNL